MKGQTLIAWIISEIVDPRTKMRWVFLGLVLVNFVSLVTFANLVHNYLPDQMTVHIRRAILLSPIGIAAFTTGVVGKSRGQKRFTNLMIVEAILLGVFTIGLVIVSELFPPDLGEPSAPALNPVITTPIVTPIVPVYSSPFPNTVENLTDGLELIPSLDLDQVSILTTLIKERGRFLSLDDLNQIPLNPTQLSQVASWLESRNMLTEESVYPILTAVANEQIAIVVLTRQARCYIEIAEQYSSIAIRRLPGRRNGRIMRYLLPDEQLLVVGHDGGQANIDRWWQVEIPSTGIEAESDYGWVHSGVVKELNENACYALSRIGD